MEKYGKNSVAQIITFGTMGAKAAIRDVGRVLGMSYGDVDRVAKAGARRAEDHPRPRHRPGPGTEGDGRGRRYGEPADPSTRRPSRASRATPPSTAAGVVITPGELTDYVPLYKPSNKDTIVTQYPGELMEDIGLPKMDFLGLQNLSVIQDALAMIRETTGDEIELDDIPPRRSQDPGPVPPRRDHRDLPVPQRLAPRIPAAPAAGQRRRPDRHERALPAGGP